MELGECAEVVITSKYGYGLEGCPPKIPPGATLTFTSEIVKIGSREPTRNDMSDDEVYQYALKQKTEGNTHFKSKHMRPAEFYYSDAINYLDARKKVTNPEWTKLRIACY